MATETMDLDMDDLFDGGGTGRELEDDYDQPQHTTAAFDDEAEEAPMRSGGGDDDEAPNEDVLAKLKDLKGAAKKRVMKPQPKLDADRLRCDRGMGSVPYLFDNIKFKGKGHEKDDLKRMMRGLEHWAHRLYPKATFDEVIERMERLGQKREVQTHIKRIRLDLPGLDEFAPPSDGEENPAEDQPDASAPQPQMDAEELYDAMLQQEREKMADEFADDMDAMNELDETGSTPAKSSHKASEDIPPPPKTPATPAGGAATPGGMTPEVRERMERNKMNALKKKAARLGVPVESLLPPKPAEISTNTSSTEESTQQKSNNEPTKPGVIQSSENLQTEDDIMDALMIDEQCMEKSKEPRNTESLHLRMTETQDETEDLQLNLSASEEKSMEKSTQNKDYLDLHLTETNEEESEALRLNLSATENIENGEDFNLHLTETENKENDKNNLNLELQDSAKEAEKGAVKGVADGERKGSDGDSSLVLRLSDNNVSQSEEEMDTQMSAVL